MINVIFNDFSFEILPKRLETYEKYCKVLKWGRANPTRFMEDFMGVSLTDHQKYILLNSWIPSNVTWVCSRSSGKMLSLDDDILRAKTKDGKILSTEWIKYGELKIGDYVVGVDGKATQVIELHPIIFENKYKIIFEDGQEVICGPEHLWSVYDFGKNTNKSKSEQMSKIYVLETQQMMGKEKIKIKHPEYRFAIPINDTILYTFKKQLIEPYLLGLWLGDGFKKRREIACEKRDIQEELNILKNINMNGWDFKIEEKAWLKNSNYGYISIHHKEDSNNSRGVKKFNVLLREMGLFNNKHIPYEYKYGNFEQRMDLLRGLFDSDGYCSKNGEFEFSQKDSKMAQDVFEILRSVGFKCSIKKEGKITKKGKNTWVYKIRGFSSKTQSLFYLTRKHDRQHEEFSLKSKYKAIDKIIRLKEKQAMRCITVDNNSGTFLVTKNMIATHNSFMSAPLIMARSLLIPNHNTYILAPSGSQAQETFTKMEDMAKGNIASMIGVSNIFLEECVKMNAAADPFTHSKQSYTVELYNGSTVNTLNSVAKNIVGIRSGFNVYDEAGKIDRDFFALTMPFCAQDTDFIVGKNINNEVYPKQLQNKKLLLSSAEGIDSELFDRYKIGFEKMLMGDPDYFVADIDCSFSLHPFMNGKPMKPLIKQSEVDDAFATNEYRAQREYYNRFDQDGSQDSLVKRGTLNKYSQSYLPIFKNETKDKKYIIAYDPSTKLDNSIIMIAEIFRDEEKGLMAKMVNCVNLIEVLANGEKMIIQKPQQIERLKDIILAYNLGAVDYDNLISLEIDAGAGGGGTDIAQFLMNEWRGSDQKMHRGWIDLEDPYMKLRADDYPGNCDKLHMFNFKRDKVKAYEATASCINQGLVIFPNPVNARGELEFEITNDDGSLSVKYEKVSIQEKNPLTQFDLAKEELVGTEKQKKTNGTVQFNLSAESKSRNMHDDRADCVAMICNKLMDLRVDEALKKEEKESDFKTMFMKARSEYNGKKANPLTGGVNPFTNRVGGGMFNRR